MTKIATAIAALFVTSSASAATTWGNVYTDMLINENAAQKESQIIGVEGGVNTGSGTELYGFFEVNPDLDNKFGKMTVHSSIVGDLGVYLHGTMFKEDTFSENRYVVGAGYQGFNGDGWSIKPYVGMVRVETTVGDTEFTSDQAAFGYAGFYAISPKTTLSSWADARVDEEDNKVKAQGSVGIQHTIIGGAYVGAFYNMNYHEQGVSGFSDSLQLRVGYSF